MAAHGVTKHCRDTAGLVDIATDPPAESESPVHGSHHRSDQGAQKALSDCHAAVDTSESSADSRMHLPRRVARCAAGVGLVALIALSALVGWLGLQANQVTREQDQRTKFLAAGREGATSLTTINPDNAEAEVTKILESSIGPFHEDFEQRSSAFVETVKRVQSRTEGTVIEAGLESVDGDHADVLVAISVKTSLAGTEAPARLWRMRISVQRVGPMEKVSNVQYVP